MKRILCLSLFLFLLLPASVWAGSAKCPKYHAILEGRAVKVPGYVAKDLMELHKVDQTDGYDGRWKVDRLVQVLECPSRGADMYIPPERLDMPGGSWMICEFRVVGNVMIADCRGGNYYLDVYQNKIGLKATNLWVGTIKGRHMEYNIHPENNLSFTLAGDIRRPEPRPLEIDIATPADHRFVFDDSKPGVLEMEFHADVTPSEYAGDVVWEVPQIEGSELTMNPPSGKGPNLKVRYEGLPEENSQFGRKTIKAMVNVGGCTAEDSQEVQVFYLRDANNNPGGEYPNWFYYWKQTPAARPCGQYINILWGGTTLGKCSEKKYRAFYKHGDHATVYVCDLGAFKNSDFEINFPLLYLQHPYYKGTRTTTYIEAFAVAIRHEYEHWIIEHNYRRGKEPKDFGPWDKDFDGLPDAMEYKWGFDNTKRQTFLADHRIVKDVDEDEEWLCFMSMQDIAPGSLDEYDWARPGRQWE